MNNSYHITEVSDRTYYICVTSDRIQSLRNWRLEYGSTELEQRIADGKLKPFTNNDMYCR